MPDPVCELCGDPTPARLVRSDPERGWDTLCPACWMLNVPGEDVVILTPETQVRLWTDEDAQRFYNA